MTTNYHLDSQQIAFFKANGYVVVPGLIDETTLAAWRNHMARDFGALDDPATWTHMQQQYQTRNHTTVPRDYRFQPETLQFRKQPGAKAIVAQLGGGQFRDDGDSNPHFLWPEPELEWTMPDRGHIDGYAGGRWYAFILGSTTYLYDVAPHCGGTIFWPGSHIKSWAYFRKHPQEIETGFQREDEYLQSLAAIEPVEITANAGDVIFWHAQLYHTASHNAGDFPRYGLFARYVHKEVETIKRDVPDDMWEHWGI